jgi:ABC-type lipoprotein export system ATPase subunit
MPDDPIIEVRKLKKSFQTGDMVLTVLDGLDLRVEKGSITAIVGKSGSGKSTLLNLIGGLDKPTGGSVRISGMPIENLPEDELSKLRNTHMGFIFQFHHLLSEFSVVENVMMPCLIAAFDPKGAMRRASELLTAMGLGQRLDYPPGKLSGGESQRVAIARALSNDPHIILADEPTGNLDFQTAESIKNLLFEMVRRYGHTMIIVTHNDSIVEDADKVYELSRGVLNPLIGVSK